MFLADPLLAHGSAGTPTPVDVWLLLRLVMAVRLGIQFFRFGFLGCNLKIVVVERPF